MLGAVDPADNSIILNQQSSYRYRHPAILATVVVNLALLSCFPTNREHFIKVGFVDEVAGVVRLSKEEVLLQAAGIDWVLLQELMHAFQSKLRSAQTPKVSNEFLNRTLASHRPPLDQKANTRWLAG